MDLNRYNSVHILSEAIIMGGISMYFYNKISELELTIEELKSQIIMQNNQIRYLMGFHIPQQNGKTSLVIPTNQPQKTEQDNSVVLPVKHNSHTEKSIKCEGEVCHLVPEKKTVISKLSKQIEYDTENIEADHTTTVNTFTNFSPNPVLKSVTPKPSETESELEKILNDIDKE